MNQRVIHKNNRFVRLCKRSSRYTNDYFGTDKEQVYVTYPSHLHLAIELYNTRTNRQPDIVISFSRQPVVTHTELDLPAPLRPPDIRRERIVIGRRIA